MTVQHADTSRFTIRADDGTPLAGRQFSQHRAACRVRERLKYTVQPGRLNVNHVV